MDNVRLDESFRSPLARLVAINCLEAIRYCRRVKIEDLLYYFAWLLRSLLSWLTYKSNQCSAQCGYIMESYGVGLTIESYGIDHQPYNFEADSSRRSLIQISLLRSPEMLLMPRVGVLCASHRTTPQRHGEESGGRCPGFRKTWITQWIWVKFMYYWFLQLARTFF